MISLDFKLTSGQVRVLLTMYHGHPHTLLGAGAARDAAFPAYDLLRGTIFNQADATALFLPRNALMRKGLVVEVEYGERLQSGAFRVRYELTPQGRAIGALPGPMKRLARSVARQLRAAPWWQDLWQDLMTGRAALPHAIQALTAESVAQIVAHPSDSPSQRPV